MSSIDQSSTIINKNILETISDPSVKQASTKEIYPKTENMEDKPNDTRNPDNIIPSLTTTTTTIDPVVSSINEFHALAWTTPETHIIQLYSV